MRDEVVEMMSLDEDVHQDERFRYFNAAAAAHRSQIAQAEIERQTLNRRRDQLRGICNWVAGLGALATLGVAGAAEAGMLPLWVGLAPLGLAALAARCGGWLNYEGGLK